MAQKNMGENNGGVGEIDADKARNRTWYQKDS